MAGDIKNLLIIIWLALPLVVIFTIRSLKGGPGPKPTAPPRSRSRSKRKKGPTGKQTHRAREQKKDGPVEPRTIPREQVLKRLRALKARKKLVRIATTFPPETQLETLAVVVDWLISHGDPSVEPYLINLLDKGSTSFKLDVVLALQHHGSKEALPRLRNLLGKTRYPALRSRIEDASAAIMARTEHEGGELSLAELSGQDGELSLDKGGGRLSLDSIDAAADPRSGDGRGEPTRP